MVADVADELRTPILWLPTDITSDTVLRGARRLLDRPTEVRPGITSYPRVVSGHPTVPVEVYERHDRPRGTAALLWVHGGGTVLGSPAAARAFCSRVADELGVLVVSVDYRLAPEHPFPAGLHDCFAVLQWLHEGATELGVDPDRIAVGGDSAGGGLAAALAQLARDEGGPSIAFQLLVYPMLDDRTVVRAEEQGATPSSGRRGRTGTPGPPTWGMHPPWTRSAPMRRPLAVRT